MGVGKEWHLRSQPSLRKSGFFTGKFSVRKEIWPTYTQLNFKALTPTVSFCPMCGLKKDAHISFLTEDFPVKNPLFLRDGWDLRCHSIPALLKSHRIWVCKEWPLRSQPLAFHHWKWGWKIFQWETHFFSPTTRMSVPILNSWVCISIGFGYHLTQGNP